MSQYNVRIANSFNRAKLLQRLHIVLLLLLFLPIQTLAAPISDEDKVKTALIFKLIKFVSWSDVESYFSKTEFGICVLGGDGFAESLKDLEGRSIKGKAISVKRYQQSRSIGKQCQIVYITSSRKAFLNDILFNLKDKPILTIGDSEDFAKKGGMIRLKKTNNRFGFEINLSSVNRSGLMIAAPLLELATIIKE